MQNDQPYDHTTSTGSGSGMPPSTSSVIPATGAPAAAGESNLVRVASLGGGAGVPQALSYQLHPPMQPTFHPLAFAGTQPGAAAVVDPSGVSRTSEGSDGGDDFSTNHPPSTSLVQQQQGTTNFGGSTLPSTSPSFGVTNVGPLSLSGSASSTALSQPYVVVADRRQQQMPVGGTLPLSVLGGGMASATGGGGGGGMRTTGGTIDYNRAPTGVPNLYVSSLPNHYTTERLCEIFGQFGDIQSARLMLSREVPLLPNRAFGFVLYKSLESAMRALQLGNGMQVDGTTVQVSASRASSTQIEREVKPRQQKPSVYSADKGFHAPPPSRRGNVGTVVAPPQHLLYSHPGMVGSLLPHTTTGGAAAAPMAPSSAFLPQQHALPFSPTPSPFVFAPSGAPMFASGGPAHGGASQPQIVFMQAPPTGGPAPHGLVPHGMIPVAMSAGGGGGHHHQPQQQFLPAGAQAPHAIYAFPQQQMPSPGGSGSQSFGGAAARR